MPVRIIIYVTWIVPAIIQVILAVVMMRTGVRKRFPTFFAYILLQVASFLVGFTCYHVSYVAYYWAYWSLAIVSAGLGFAVMREVLRNILNDHESLQDLGDVLFKWAAVVLIMVAVVAAASSNSAPHYRLTLAILALERSVRVIECGLVLFLLLFSSHMGISTKHHVFGVALGFGVYGAVELLTATLRSFVFIVDWWGFDIIKGVVWGCTAVIWLYYLRAPEPQRKPIQARAQTERWNWALAGLSVPVSQDSFLPMVESAVERVLTRRNVITPKKDV